MRQNIEPAAIILDIMPIGVLVAAMVMFVAADDHSAGVEFYKQRQFAKTIESLERAVATEKPGSPSEGTESLGSDPSPARKGRPDDSAPPHNPD